ncbi:MAG: hypothetical protein K0A99_05090 [Desulfoarculaceae bacterium]|nr:hypothetical protein [Desulfoarculaceae bacterium]
MKGKRQKNRIFYSPTRHCEARSNVAVQRYGATVTKTSCATSPPFAQTGRVLWIASLPLAKTMSLSPAYVPYIFPGGPAPLELDASVIAWTRQVVGLIGCLR